MDYKGILGLVKENFNHYAKGDEEKDKDLTPMFYLGCSLGMAEVLKFNLFSLCENSNNDSLYIRSEILVESINIVIDIEKREIEDDVFFKSAITRVYNAIYKLESYLEEENSMDDTYGIILTEVPM